MPVVLVPAQIIVKTMTDVELETQRPLKCGAQVIECTSTLHFYRVGRKVTSDAYIDTEI
jgi:hypothetical protein